MRTKKGRKREFFTGATLLNGEDLCIKHIGGEKFVILKRRKIKVTENLYKERQILRDELRKIYHLDNNIFKNLEYEMKIKQKLHEIHSQITEIELNNKDLKKARYIYSVCGWSERHAYFRNKRFQSESLEEAKKEFEVCKKEKNWAIPTVIVKETYLREKSLATIDFDGDYNRFSFCDIQEIIEKNMCGVRGIRWKDLIPSNMDRFTY